MYEDTLPNSPRSFPFGRLAQSRVGGSGFAQQENRLIRRWALEVPPFLTTPPSISFVSSLCRSSLPSLITHSSIIGQVPHYGNIFSSDLYLHGVPELVGIVGGRWVHEAHHDFLEVIGKLLLQVTNQVLWREKQIPSLYRLPILWEKWDNCRKSSSTISFSTSLHIITSLVLVHTCVRGLHEIVDLRVWKWLMWRHLCMKHHLYGCSSHVNTEGYSFPNPNPTPLLISLWK